MNHINELNKIIELRKNAFALDTPLIIAILLGIASQFIVPVITPLIGGAIFIIFYKKIIKAAHAPCPNCGEPFGTASKWPLGVGANKCQNCNQELYGN